MEVGPDEVAVQERQLLQHSRATSLGPGLHLQCVDVPWDRLVCEARGLEEAREGAGSQQYIH